MTARATIHDFLCSAFYGQHMQRAGCDARAPDCGGEPPVGPVAREVGAAPLTPPPTPNTAPCIHQQPTLASGCEGRAAERNKRRQGAVTHGPSRMSGKGEPFHIHSQ